MAYIYSTVFVFESTKSLLHIVLPEAFIVGRIHPQHFSKAKTLTVTVGTGELGDSGPDFHSLSVLEVIQPLTSIQFTCHSLIFPFAIPFVSGPVSCINTSVSLMIGPYTKSLVIAPISFKSGPIHPSHCSLPMSQPSQPLTLINSTRSILMLSFTDRLFWVEKLLSLKRLSTFTATQITIVH